MKVMVEASTGIVPKKLEDRQNGTGIHLKLGTTVFVRDITTQQATEQVDRGVVTESTTLFEKPKHEPLTKVQRNTLLLKIRGLSDAAISQRLSLREEDINEHLYAGYDKLQIASPPASYDTQLALAQAAIQGVMRKQLDITEFARDFPMDRGKLLYDNEREQFDRIIDERAQQETPSEINPQLDAASEMLGGATLAEAALFYLAYQRDQRLTEVDRRVVYYLVKQHGTSSNSDIANAMYVSINTIKTHNRSIYCKLGVSSREQVVEYYRSSNTNVGNDAHTRTRQQDVVPGSSFNLALTNKEKEVLSLVILNISNKEIAEVLGISVYTLKTHLGAIYRKVGVTGRMGAANFQKLEAEYKKTEITSGEQEAVPQIEEHLTAAEEKVLSLVTVGISNREIASMLGVSINTIKTHLKAIYRKVGVTE